MDPGFRRGDGWEVAVAGWIASAEPQMWIARPATPSAASFTASFSVG